MQLFQNVKATSVVLCSVGIVLSSHVQAQTRVIEGPRVLEKRGGGQAVVKASEGAQKQLSKQMSSDAKVFVKNFSFIGNEHYSSAELLDLLKPQIDKYYTLGDLLGVVEGVTQLYRSNGYLVAKAILPEQEIDAGVVNIRILEGRLSSVAIKEDRSSSSLVSDLTQVEKIFLLNFCGDERLDSASLTQSRVDRAISVLEDVAGVRVIQADLQPGEEVGGVGLDVQISPREPYQLELGVDNFGNSYTGVKRAQTRFSMNGLLNPGDQFGFSYLGTDQTNLKYYGLDYSAPLGFMGWRLGGAAGRTHYVVPGAASVSGSADVRSLNVNYPVARSSQSSIDFVAEYEVAQLGQDAGVVENKRRNAVRLGVSGAFQDQILDIGRSNNEWSLAITKSDLSFENPVQDTQQTSGFKTKLAWRLNRLQGLGAQGWFAGGNAYGQFATGNLDPYSKLALGGAAGVRAYAAGEAAGDRAVVTQLSLGDAWNSNFFEREFNFSLAGFYDRGWSQLQKNPTVVDGNSQVRSGYGLEFQMAKKNSMNMRVFWAKALNGISTYDSKDSRVGVNFGFAF